jgi:hypothetical protein
MRNDKWWLGYISDLIQVLLFVLLSDSGRLLMLSYLQIRQLYNMGNNCIPYRIVEWIK